MGGLGWTEMMLIGVVALIVIGPKDLPDMFRQLGRFTGKMRSMARDFQRAMDDAAKASGVADVAKDIKTIASPKALGLSAVKDAADRFEKWDPLKPARAPIPPVGTPLTPKPVAPAASVSTVADTTVDPSPAPVKPEGPATAALRAEAAARKVAARVRAKPVTPAQTAAESPPE